MKEYIESVKIAPKKKQYNTKWTGSQELKKKRKYI